MTETARKAIAERLAAHEMAPMPKVGDAPSKQAPFGYFKLDADERDIVVAALRAAPALVPRPICPAAGEPRPR